MKDLKELVTKIKENPKGAFLIFVEEKQIEELREFLKNKLFKSREERIFDWIEPLELKIEAIREALKRMWEKKLKNFKVFFLADFALVDKLTQNIFLKALEEVRKGEVYILVSSSEENVLKTVLSRCQKIRIRAKEGAISNVPFFEREKKINFKSWLAHKPSDLKTLKSLLWEWVIYYKNKNNKNLFGVMLDSYLTCKKINVNLELFWINLYFELITLL